MPTDSDNDRLKEAYETNSQRYGNDKTIEDVFDRPTQPTQPELVAALADTDILTEQEASAFVRDHFDHYPSNLVQECDFDDPDEYEATKQKATRKVADAIWIYELINAYRFPDFPEECRECGRSLGGRWIGDPHEGESGVLCVDCADVDTDQYY